MIFSRGAEPSLSKKFLDSAQKNCYYNLQNYFVWLTLPNNYLQKSRILGTLSPFSEWVPCFCLINTKKIFLFIFGCWLLPKKFSFCPKNNDFAQVWRTPGLYAYVTEPGNKIGSNFNDKNKKHMEKNQRHLSTLSTPSFRAWMLCCVASLFLQDCNNFNFLDISNTRYSFWWKLNPWHLDESPSSLCTSILLWKATIIIHLLWDSHIHTRHRPTSVLICFNSPIWLRVLLCINFFSKPQKFCHRSNRQLWETCITYLYYHCYLCLKQTVRSLLYVSTNAVNISLLKSHQM